MLIAHLKNLTCTFAVRITDTDDPPWVIHVHEGRLSEPDGSEPACTFVVDSQTCRQIVMGLKPPEEAFFEMKVDVQGDLELGLKVSTVLAPFFRRFPFSLDGS